MFGGPTVSRPEIPARPAEDVIEVGQSTLSVRREQGGPRRARSRTSQGRVELDLQSLALGVYLLALGEYIVWITWEGIATGVQGSLGGLADPPQFEHWWPGVVERSRQHERWYLLFANRKRERRCGIAPRGTALYAPRKAVALRTGLVTGDNGH